MNSFMENLTGMNTMTDQVVASDLLLAAKTAVRNYAYALTEAATPDVRTILHKQLDDAIATHEKVTNYMMNKGYYHAYNVNEQIQVDMKNAETAMNLPNAPTSLL
ncbi:spore gernimation protein GerQ [Aneurinibacillus migulanus]|uniref:Similar to spore coat protein n=1 Tax=Aneurinibacillus migulanus TaxID=47500 RepID=A0A0D1XUB8_ANEMI|nr:spore coat protein [Aneurinibacillus migulanus]KIV50692.1 spore gernimation protein GerQ [Aneurinibacillus migulanus]KIV50862.1 spore gernimation protein GerQ [Aneurinibacillus migulanus]KON99383.1 spore gernimation protein GerQ [Aneurinibacillus migulanus]KPD09605.1 spore gernimation protein GerQ [Aneurinibacillus migulanus]MCP1358592.1 spore coat protein [Aneurinibacillus migulanus]